MNEQLVVKNFGPIKEATVDFKRVTVFIGPTGGGKSTLAKLGAVFRELRLYTSGKNGAEMLIQGYGMDDFYFDTSLINWQLSQMNSRFSNGKWDLGFQPAVLDKALELAHRAAETSKKAQALVEAQKAGMSSAAYEQELAAIEAEWSEADTFFSRNAASSRPRYIPAERTLLSVLDEAWPTIANGKIDIPPALSFFAQGFLEAKSIVKTLRFEPLSIIYEHLNGRDYISQNLSKPLLLSKSASGIQSVIPILVLIEYLSRVSKSAQSFIIEEPELNLYPTAQQGLLNWLVEKCTKGENDLTITTHSPYILASCNLLLEAYKVAKQRPELADEIDKIVPRACWLNPDEFAAYYVADGTVKAITDERTHLIGGNELDAVSGDISDSFRRLLQLKKQVA